MPQADPPRAAATALTRVQAGRVDGHQEPLPLLLPAEGTAISTQGRGGTARPRAPPRWHPAPGTGRFSTRGSGAAAPGSSPAALPAGDEQREDVEGEEDAQAEEHAAHVGLRCTEPGQALRGERQRHPPGTCRGVPCGAQQPPTPNGPSQTHRLWRATPSPPASSAGCADPRAHLEEGTDWGLSGCCSSPHPEPHPPGGYLGRHLWRGGSRAEPPRTPRPPSSPPPPRRSCGWGNPSSAVAVPGG